MNKKQRFFAGKKIEQYIFILSMIILAILYGIFAEKRNLFPANMIKVAIGAYNEIGLKVTPWYEVDTPHTKMISRKAEHYNDARLNKLVHFDKDNDLGVSIRNQNGGLIHKWRTNWFELWGDANQTHIFEFQRPKQKPGTTIHGAHVFSNGDLVFNFESLGMVKLDVCGNVLWRLPQQTHHSIFLDDNGDIWASMNGAAFISDELNSLHNFVVDPQMVKVSSDGNILFKKSIITLLQDNNLHGILYLSAHDNVFPVVKGDTIHLNDVEVFSSTMTPGFFKPGDIMVSLRNPNVIVVFDPSDWSVKHIISNVTVRQHDPDFIDGNTIAIFDNNTRFRDNSDKAYSRIIKVAVPSNSVEVIFQGSSDEPFFTETLGKQQWLDNGNILFSESTKGRALEIDPQGNIVWEYVNLIEPNFATVLIEAERLPIELNEKFFKEKTKTCKSAE